MSHGPFFERLLRGTRWTWRSDRYREALPSDLDATVMAIETADRFHAKQGRSTARYVFQTRSGPLPVYLKRHYVLPWRSRLGALVNPGGRHSPAAAEWGHLERARAMGVAVPESLAAGERIGPWGALESYLIIAELTGCDPLHEAIPALAATLAPVAFEQLKRTLVARMAAMTAKLHAARAFHKDLYLCHFYLDRALQGPDSPRLHLIDLHRLAEHRIWPDRWRWKDLGQLLFSTHGVEGISNRDCLRFWVLYQRSLGVRLSRFHLRMIRMKAAKYLAHNR
jgi:heptose I phosphotransferase